MSTRVGRVEVLARAATLTATTLATSAGAHAVAGGHLASPALLSALGVLLLAAAMPVSRARLSLPALLAWSALAQLLVHLALTWLHPTAGTTVAVPAHHGLETAAATTSGAPGALLPMLAAHALGTTVAMSLIVAADRSAGRARSWWQGTVATLVGAPLPAGRTHRLLVARRPARPAGHLLAHSMARRGPPAGLLAV